MKKKRKATEKSVPRRGREGGRRRSVWWIPVAMAALAGLYYLVATSSPGDRGIPARTTIPETSSGADSSRDDVPPFHADPERAKPFPSTLDPARFPIRYVARAYAIAQEIPDVLAQQPCYCYCQEFGHQSLLDCYRTDHGAG
jgi:hypothetical protein